jgi:glycosyltransferase involved in cell wall biosynthesis
MVAYSIIIPTFNRSQALKRTITALAEQRNAPPFSVIVVDDGSTDDTPQALRDLCASLPFSMTVLSQENAGQASARNRALEVVDSEFVVFLGDDIIPEPCWLAAHARAQKKYADSKIAVLGFTDWPDEPWVNDYMRFLAPYGLQFNYSGLADEELLDFGYFYTSNISLPTSLLGEERFDPEFSGYGCEDQELGYRLQERNGMRIRLCLSAKAFHWHPISRAKAVTRSRSAGVAMRIVTRKHPELLNSRFFPGPPLLILLACLSLYKSRVALIFSRQLYWKAELYYHKYAGYIFGR